jgi:hypothetical protein
MRHFADPSRCPDCGSSLTLGSTTCVGCRLDLSGPLAAELFTTLTRADNLLAQLRQRTWTAPSAVPTVSGPGPAAAAGSPYPTPAVRGTSVPQVLLGLGAVCLLVAALVFLAVTWSVMGVGGRTATLVGFTLTTGALTTWAARRGLRGAVEALGAVTLGLAVLDLYGADNAGWLGSPSEAAMSTLVGVALVASGLATVSALGRTEAKGFTVGEVAVALGATMVSVGLASQSWGTVPARVLLALCIVLALTVVVRSLVRAGSTLFVVAAWLLVPAVALSWLALVLVGLEELGAHPTMASVWADLGAWPLVAAAAVALLVAVPRRLPVVVRVVSAGIALVPLGLAVLAPAGDESTTVALLALTTVAAALVVLMTVAPAPWRASGLGAGALCALGFSVELLSLSANALEQYVDAASMAWSGSIGGRLPALTLLGGEAGWLLPVCVVALLALVWSAVRLLEDGRALDRQVGLGVAGVALGLSLVLTLLLYPVPVWAVLLVLVAGALVLAYWSLARDRFAAAVLCAATLSAAVVLSWYDDQLTAMTVAAALGATLVMHLWSRREVVATLAGAGAAVLLAGLVWTVGAITDAPAAWTGLVGLLLLSAVALGRHRVSAGLRTTRVDAVLELAVACAAVVLVSAAFEMTADADRSGWVAIYLTVAGAAATVLAIVRRDRRKVAWLGGLLLAAATWVRLSELGVEEPEPYTLPTALALLVVGLVRLRRDGSASTHEALGAGLLLALVPSMLWVVDEPGGIRSALLGLACLAVVVGGAQLRWVAPLVHGAFVGLVVVLVEAGPHVGDAVPRWALIGAAGALLIALGVTWEQRLRDARLVTSYVRALR